MSANTNKKKSNALLVDFFDILESLVFAIAVVVLLFVFIGRLTVVSGHSMEGTLQEGDYLVVSNPFFSYTPKQGDVVVIHGDFEGKEYDNPLIKRVIATEGQTIRIDFNYDHPRVYVNNERYDDSEFAIYLNLYRYPTLSYTDSNGESHLYYNGNTRIFETTVPEGCIFAMGDNRNNSGDSRIDEIGFIKEEFVVGEAVFRLMPLRKIGKF